MKTEKNIPDIYFDKHYGDLFVGLEGIKSDYIDFQNEHGRIIHQVMVREIEEKIDGLTYYDWVTPYGFGGPLIVEITGDKEQLLRDFNTYLKDYTNENNIVSEFVKFHPIVKNADDFTDIYDVSRLKTTISTLLGDNAVQTQFHRNAKSNWKRAKKNGVTVEIEYHPENIDTFIEIYEASMERLHASDFYYFTRDFFDKLLENFRDHLVVTIEYMDGRAIGASLNFLWGEICELFLAGTSEVYKNVSPTSLAIYELFQELEQDGYKFVHFGGGLTNSEDDSLLAFKKRYTRGGEHDYMIGKKVWNEDVYAKLCALKGVENLMNGFFPAYRENKEAVNA
jgi:hypothetical protein